MYSIAPDACRPSLTTKAFCSFLPAVSASALTSIRTTIRELNIRRRTHVSMDDIADQLNPFLLGWIEYLEYYGRYTPSALGPIMRYVYLTIESWMMRKF